MNEARMSSPTRFPIMLGLVASLAGVAVACSDDSTGMLRGSRAGGASSSSSSGGGDPNDPNNPNATSTLPREEELFNALEAELTKKCGGACHTDGTFTPKPPTFLTGATTADRYKSVKSFPGIVVPDRYQSTLVTKGAHAGPAINADPVFEKTVMEWLTQESLAITAVGSPTTDPVTIVQGANEIDLTKASTGVSGAKITFDASLLAGMLSLSNIKLVAPAGTDTHILKPKFIRVLPAPVNGRQAISDPADNFSNVDQVVAGGSSSALGPGTALFSGDGWRPFDLAKDKIRIEAQKVEKGTVQVAVAPQTCKNVQMFQTNVLPSLRGTTFQPNCAGCHGGGLAGLSLNSQDAALVCLQVMGKLNQANIGQSVMVTKVTAGPHNGGLVNDANGWRTLFMNNAAAFY
jgi:hypothetical protein